MEGPARVELIFLHWYNFNVPTPFYHLDIAESLLVQDDLPAGFRRLLEKHKSAFTFGNVAPDVQVISGQKRAETHFYNLPVEHSALTPWDRIFQLYPELFQPQTLSPVRAVFLAGYFCHLQADWYWAVEIYEPNFGVTATWNTFRQRLYLHNVLRSYMDLQGFACINGYTRESLEQVALDQWLPFAADNHLRAWRDLLADQLKPGAEIQTVEVFASRQGIPPGTYYDLLNSDEALDREIFVQLPRYHLDTYRRNLINKNIVFLETYLQDLV